jgi:hypothetical protein
LAALSAGEALAQAQVPSADDAVAFVRDFYTREIARHNAKERLDEGEFLNTFTRETRRIWIAARDNKNPPQVPLGLVVNAFFGPGALPGREVKFVQIGVVGGGAQLLVVAVDVVIDGNPRKLHVHVVRDGNTWRFDDIDYGGRESFVSYHRRRAGI